MISVIIPYVRDRVWLHTAVTSIHGQTFTDWQVIPIKGDRTQGANINRGLRIAKGEYIKILHDDDRLPFDSLANLCKGIHGFDFVCGDASI